MNIPPADVEALRKELDEAKSRRKRLRIMMHLSFHLRVLDPERSLELAEEALPLSRALGNHLAAINAAISVSWHCINNGDFPRSETALRIAATHLREMDDPRLTCLVEHCFGCHYRGLGDLPKAFDYFGRALDLSRTFAGPMNAQVLGSMAETYAKIGSHARALEILTEILAIWTRAGNQQYMAMTMNSIGGIYKDLRQWDRALELFGEGLTIVREMGSTMGEATFLANIGMVHSASGSHETALGYLEQALALEREVGRKPAEASMHAIIAESHFKLGRYSKALESIGRSLEICREIGDESDAADHMLLAGDIHMDLGELDAALPYFERGLEIAVAHGLMEVERSAHDCMARLHDRLDDPRSAIPHHRRYAELTDVLRGEEVARAMTSAQISLQVERAEKEREIYRIRAEQLERELDHKAQELTTMALHVAQKNELVGWLQAQVRPFIRPSGRDASELASILMPKIRENAGVETQWEQFEGQFLQLHPGFMGALAERCPTLTQMEIRICSLLRINLSNKEIALILGLSVRTIEGHRRFIRKKLGIPSDGNISLAIASVG